MHVVSYNINGLRAARGKGFLDWLEDQEADVVLLQETKANPLQLPGDLTRPYGWKSTFFAAQNPGYSGVGVYWRDDLKPDEVVKGLGIERFDAEGRAIMIRFDDLIIWGCYFPNGGRGPERVAYKLDFYDALLEKIAVQRADGLRVIVTGDFNIAHRDTDLANPGKHSGRAGALPEERARLDRLAALGFVDVFRHLNPDATDVYTWWSFKTAGRRSNTGWRIDTFWVDPETLERLDDMEIDSETRMSDHAPIHLFLD
jgi:exodeoxyribonuclease-3